MGFIRRTDNDHYDYYAEVPSNASARIVGNCNYCNQRRLQFGSHDSDLPVRRLGGGWQALLMYFGPQVRLIQDHEPLTLEGVASQREVVRVNGDGGTSVRQPH